MKFESPKSIRIVSPEGARVSVDLSGMKLRKDQKAAVAKIISRGGLGDLTRKEWDSIKDLRARIGGSAGDVALIVRFDLKWVRIDERGLDFEEAIRTG